MRVKLGDEEDRFVAWQRAGVESFPVRASAAGDLLLKEGFFDVVQTDAGGRFSVSGLPTDEPIVFSPLHFSGNSCSPETWDLSNPCEVIYD